MGILHRKLVSAATRLTQYIRNANFLVKMKLLGINIHLGKNVSVGRMVNVRTTDGGHIHLDDRVSLDDFAYLYAQRGCLLIGRGSYIGVGSQLVAIDSVQIGKHCLISAYAVIRDAEHGMVKGQFIGEQKQCSAPIIIEDDVWLGSHVVVTSGCRIGTGAVIGANAVVTKEIPDNSIAAGVPARVINER